MAMYGQHSVSSPSQDLTTTSLNNKNKKMSWQSYVDDQLLATKMVSKAAICGHDGNVWATSAGFGVTAPELKFIATNFGNMSVMPMSGINVGGTKYMFLSANDKVMRGKKGTSGVHIMKTVQAIIVCVYHEPIVAEQCANTTEKLGEYLIGVGY